MHQVLHLSDDRTVVMRRATSDDAEAIWQLYHRIYGGHYTLPIVNVRAQREEALADPDCLWLVDEAPDGQLVGSVIFTLNPEERTAKVFAAVVEPEYRRDHLMYLTLHAGIQQIMFEARVCDVIYATTRTRTMGPDQLLTKLGFISLGIFPNVHRLTEYETHGLKVLYHPSAFEARRRLPQLIPEVAGFYDIVRRSYGLEPAEIVPVEGKLHLNLVRGPQVAEEYAKCREEGNLMLDFFPFHPPTHLFASDNGQVKAFINYEGKDGHGVLVALQAIRESVQHLEHLFNIVYEAGRTLGIDYMELLVSAYEPKQQRAALSAKFLPCAYFPSMRHMGGEREDYLVFARSSLALDFSHVQMTPRDRRFLDAYLINTEFRNLVVQMQEGAQPDRDPYEHPASH